MKKITALFAALALTMQTGCFYHHVFRVGPGEPETFSKDWGWSHHLLGGLITVSGTVYANGICPNGVAEVDDYISFWNILVSTLTGLIWTPSTWRVYCVSPEGKRTEREITITPTRELVAKALREYPAAVAEVMQEQKRVSAVATR